MLVLPILLLLIYGSADYHYRVAPEIARERQLELDSAKDCEPEADKVLESEVDHERSDATR